MSSPMVYIEEQLALRESLARSVELMENHLGDPQRSPRFGMLESSEDVTEERVAELKEQIADIDARIERLRSGNA